MLFRPGPDAAERGTKAALHSWTQSPRVQLSGTGILVHELAPPAVQTDLMPGQRTAAHAMPFDAFIDEVMGLLAQDPVPEEILVQRVLPLRNAEAEGKYGQIFAMLNGSYKA